MRPDRPAPRLGANVTRFKRICVFCGGNEGVRPEYAEAAIEVGKLLASRNIGIVYGGATVGLMGALANAALAAGGEVLGVIPEKLMRHEIGHAGVTELFVVESMHARKGMMSHLSQAFIALPGGWGTLEETFEVLTWTQLRYHVKPVGLLNVEGFYDHLLAHADRAVEEGFIRAEHRALLIDSDRPEELLERLENTLIPDAPQWIERP